MQEMAYTWQNQGPVSINSCLTIEYLLKECIEGMYCNVLKRFLVSLFFERSSWAGEIHVNWIFGAQRQCYRAKRVFFYYCLVAMVTIEAVGFKPRWSLILEMNFPLPVWVLCTKMIFAPEWSNARNGIYMTKSRTSFNKQLLDYWVFIKGMHHWRGSSCLSSSNGHHGQGKFVRIESEKNKHTCLVLMSRFILV